jgi:hypothetical protein
LSAPQSQDPHPRCKTYPSPLLPESFWSLSTFKGIPSSFNGLPPQHPRNPDLTDSQSKLGAQIIYTVLIRPHLFSSFLGISSGHIWTPQSHLHPHGVCATARIFLAPTWVTITHLSACDDIDDNCANAQFRGCQPWTWSRAADSSTCKRRLNSGSYFDLHRSFSLRVVCPVRAGQARLSLLTGFEPLLAGALTLLLSFCLFRVPSFGKR